MPQSRVSSRPGRRTRLRVAVASVAAIVVVVGVMVGVKLARSGGSEPVAANTGAAAAAAATLASAPTAGVPAEVAGGVRAPAHVPAGVPRLTRDGKPEVFYLGAEYCPYCAAQRWALVTALSRFGSFSGLRQSHSSTSDVYPDTPTFSFVGSTYRSDVLSFSAVETADVAGRPLQTATPQQLALARRISGSSGIPFVSFGNAFFVAGASYDPGVLSGHSFADIAAATHRPATQPGASVVAAANAMTATLCELTGGRPAGVCDRSEIAALRPSGGSGS